MNKKSVTLTTNKLNLNEEVYILSIKPGNKTFLKTTIISSNNNFKNFRHTNLYRVSGTYDKDFLGSYIFDKEFNLPAGSNVLIPKKGLVEVAKFLDSDGQVKIGIKDNNFIVKKEKETLIIRLLEGDFPQYGDIVVKADDYDIPMDRQLFLMMLKRMSILSSDEYKGVIFHFGKNKLRINSTNPDIGESKEDMDIGYQGDPIEVMYNPKFFIDTLSVLNEENVILNIVDEERPCKIEGEKDKTYLSVIMPMRI